MPSPRQQDLLDAIVQLTAEKGFPPTTRELAEHLGIWNSAAGRMLQRLRDEGRVTWEDGRARTLAVVDLSSGP